MIDMFLEIGFELINQKDGEVCYEREYKYYPDYMEDRHYTLIRFAYIKENYSDWRLYIHENKDGRYVESPFQLSDYTDRNKITIKGYFDKIFFAEIRNQKLEELGI